MTRNKKKIDYLMSTGISSNTFDSLVTPDYFLEKTLFTAMKKVKKNYATTICTRS